MNRNLQNKLTKFGIYLVLYTFGIFVFFNFVFAKKETKIAGNTVKEVETKSKTLNANGIDVSKLSTKVNTGKKANIVTTTDYNIAMENIISGQAQIAYIGAEGILSADKKHTDKKLKNTGQGPLYYVYCFVSQS